MGSVVVRHRLSCREACGISLDQYLNWCPVCRREDIKQRYKDKYRQEPYVWALTVDEKLQLYKEKELLVKYSGRKLNSSLGQIELLL